MESSVAEMEAQAIDELISQRAVLRKRKCFEEADQISSSLRSRDIVISDNADGTTTWKLKQIPATIEEEDRPPRSRTSARYRKMLSKNMRRKAVKSRGREFAKWVMHQFEEFLAKECTTILDVAGGKGEVSYCIASHLLLLPSASKPPPHCLIIDPMPVSLSRQKTKDLIRKSAHLFRGIASCDSSPSANITSNMSSSAETNFSEKSENNTTYELWFQANQNVVSRMPSYGGHFQPVEHFQLAMHLRADKRVLWLDRVTLLNEAEREFGTDDSRVGSGSCKQEVISDTDCDNSGSSSGSTSGTCSCQSIIVPMKACQAARSALHSLDALNIQHIQDYFNSELISTRLSHLLTGASANETNKFPASTLLLGFHPDEPTSDIVDMALQYSMPFVVVPCCVFPSKFSTRVLKNGKAVRSFEDFILFLKEKDHRIRECVLGALLKPNNIALFMLPADFVI